MLHMVGLLLTYTPVALPNVLPSLMHDHSTRFRFYATTFYQ
jgi:hypothetical protein